MNKTHISSPPSPSSDLFLLFQKALAEALESQNLVKDISAQAMTNAITSGIIEMLKEGNLKLDELEDGKINEKEFASTIFQKGAKSAATTGAKTVAALSIREGAKGIAKRFGQDLCKRFGAGTLTAVAFGVVEQGIHTVRWMNGEIDDKRYKIQTAENLGSASGALGGAAIGSMIPGLGTMVGAIVGGMIGSYGGSAVGKSIGEDLFDEEEKKQ